MDHGAMDNASLISSVVQLEHERVQLQRNPDQAFTLQSGIFSGLDLVSRIHSRRSSELGQELEDCGKKLHFFQKENAKLQEELEETYSIKSKFAEQLKLEVEKSASLEKEVKYFQSKVAAAFSARDRALLEVDKLQRKRDGLIEQVADLQDRLDHVISEYTEEKGLCEVLYSKLENFKEENDLHKKVTEKFWKIQEQTSKSCIMKDIQEKAAVLLQGPEYLWCFGEPPSIDLQNKAKQVLVDEELASCQASSIHVQIKSDKELSSRNQPEDKLSSCEKNQFYMAERIGKELQQLNLLKRCLKEEALSFFLEQKKQILYLQELLHLVINNDERKFQSSATFLGMEDINLQKFEVEQEEKSQADTQFSISSRASLEDPDTAHSSLASEDEFFQPDIGGIVVTLRNENSAERCTAVDANQGASQKPCLSGRFGTEKFVEEDKLLRSSDDSRALAQALQEKVSALLLLSQQEERHILESNVTFALESQISSLRQQLVQVTSEKMDALVKLSCTQEKCVKLQEQEKAFKKLMQQSCTQTRGPGHFEEPSVSTNGNANGTLSSSRKAVMQSYLKHLWSRGHESGTYASLSNVFPLLRNKEHGAQNDPRWRLS